MRRVLHFPILLLLPLLYGLGAAHADEFSYEGRKKCSSCHKSQSLSWQETAHAKAFESLRPGIKDEAKRKAGLDPRKDFTRDKDCVRCHVTGFGKEGGYDARDPDEYLIGVSCEACHGPGSRYQLVHRTAGEAFETTKKATPRQVLVDAGEEFEFVERCNACHMNYEGTPWPGAKPPYTPFTPKVDPKYGFDFAKAVRDDKAMHAHFKLGGTFTGPPLPSFHEEFQAKARPTAQQ